MKQAVLTSPETITFSEIDKPVIKPNEILMKVKNIGICGSDIHAYYGKHPFMSFPIRLGHEMAGEVVEVGSEVKGINVGDLVTAMPQEFCHECEPCKSGRYNICDTLEVIGCQTPGAACEYFNVDSALIKKIPDGMSARIAATIEPAAVGVHAVRRSGSVKGMNVVVMGAGTIGNVTAQAAMAEGAKSVLITDFSDYRLELAGKCGIPHTANTGKVSMQDAIKEAAAVLESQGAKYRNLSIDSASAAGKYASDIMAFPTTILVDRNGNIVGEPMLGGIDNQENYDTLMKQIQSVIDADSAK